MKYCIVTYSHTKCKDLWKPYFDRLRRYGPQVDKFLMVDSSDTILTDSSLEDIEKFVYDDDNPFSNQWLEMVKYLKDIGYDYFIYSQEDFILYDFVNESGIHDAIAQIENNNTEYVKFIKSGGTEYSMQASIHNIEKFINFYNKYQIDSIRQEGFLSQCSTGEYESKFLPMAWVGEKRGLFHYDSKVWPYIATALNKGKWNISEYEKELTYFQQEYMVEFDVRGTI